MSEDRPNEPGAADAEALKALAAAQAAVSAASAGNAADAGSSADDEALRAAAAAVASVKAAAVDTASSAEGAAGGHRSNAKPFEPPMFETAHGATDPTQIELLRDVDLDVSIELGRTRMLVEDVLKLGDGAVVELDKLAGDPVDVFVNGRHVARGEVLVLNDNFCVRVNEIIDPYADGGD